MTAYEKLIKCYECVKSKIDFEPKVALVLGSGLGDYANSIDVKYTLSYNDIEGFPTSTVEGHKGQFVFGYVGEVPVVIMQGRVHYYEGLTNASGGVNAGFKAGDFMLITDHISSFVPNPLIGKNIDELGTRFPDMSEIYNKKLRDIISGAAEDLDITLRHGVYLQLTGPSFESPAEIRMARTIGADAVGMSTACEAIAANHAGMKVCGISCVANLAAGMTDNPLTHAEVQECADKAAPLFKKLITESIIRIGKQL